MPFARLSLPSIRAKLYILVLACALPILVGYVALARDAALRERDHVSRDAQTVAEVLAAAVDRDIQSGETAARVLAATAMMARGDMVAIHTVARSLLRPDFPAQAFVLSLPNGMPLINTRYPIGAPLPRTGNEDDIRRVAETGNTVASGLHRLDGGGQYALSVEVPIWYEGEVRFVLSVHLRPRRMAELLDSQHLPEGWIASIHDRHLLTVSRSADGGQHLGLPMEPALAKAVTKGNAGTVALPQDGGGRGFAAFAHSPAHGWVVTIRYPHNAAGELLGQSMAKTVAAIAVLLAISLALAWALGGSIARAVQGLAGPAERLGSGEPLVLPPSDIREVEAVAHALRRVDAELQEHRRGLETLVAERTQELKRSKAQLETVYASIPVGLCFMDAELRVVMVNDYLADINGRPARDHAGRSLPELLGPVGEEYEANYRRVIASGRPLVEVEATGDAPSAPGSARHWISSYFPVYGPDRQLMGVNAVVLDITDRKRQQQRERDHQEMFRALFEAAGDAHLLLAYGASYVSANQAAADLFGFATPAALLEESPASLSPLLQIDGRPSNEVALEHMRRTLDEGRDAFEWLHLRADGSEFHADILLTRVDIGGVGMMQATIRDISTRVAAEAALRATGVQLEAALRLAEQASRAKSEFLANMSHELRTPMNAIVGLARLLEEGQLGQRERGYVARMRTAARSLLGMLSDLLDFSRIEAGQLTLERIPLRIDDILASIAVLHGPGAWAKGVELAFAVDPHLPPLLQGDPVRLEQVLLNLVGNAVKFTDRGEIVLSIALRGAADGQVRLAFEVRDTGIGIAPEVQAGIFEVFSQADSSTVRKYGGAGLGLSIARRLVELAGGALRLDSVPGAGTSFRFELSFPVLEAAPGTPALEDDALRVLVADDNASARGALAAACTAFGWRVETVPDGDAALDVLRRSRYDLAFVDQSMPGLDGVPLISAVRAAQVQMPRLCLLAPDPDTERYAELADELGVAAVLGKPFTGASLRAAVDRLLGGAGAAHPAPASTPLAGALRGLRVLVVEDNLINQEVASFILAHAGATFEIAANGRAALSMLQEDAAFDVVLMDLQMPVMNGFEATAAIRAAGLDLPIVAMTANAMDEDRQRSLDAGMQAHLAKPIDVDALVATLSRVTDRPQGTPAAASAEPALPASLPHLPGIDLKSTLPRFAGSVERFCELFIRYAEGQAQTFGELRAHVEAGERGAAGQLAHRLRGVSANLGATEAAETAHALEHALRDADDGTVRLRLADLARALEAVTATARELAPPAANLVSREVAQDLPGMDEGATLHDTLARLLHLLENNNMRAIAAEAALRPALALDAGQPAAAALADAVATLRFDEAARQVADLMMRKGTL
ncbi:response regulator [Massilia sp. CFBP9026]|uniref:response regulator n=1 Tax=Massilia sp. CFBP9026 TaxID=3096536 RepID=UPI002A69B730|nr:response regulator [Massilia sp. CFBP9026]MDY0964106.1 response regulator [Massilia sp. CFBP9026]